MIETFFKEIKSEYEELRIFYNCLKESGKHGMLKGMESDTIFFGCGDSYAVSMAISEIVNCNFGDPYEWQFKKLPKGKIFVFVSVSGRTNANINLAKKAKKDGNKIIVITGNDFSELASVADDVININYKERIILPGTLSFTKSLISSFSLFGLEINFESLYKEINNIFKTKFGFFNGDTLFIIASPAYYPLSYYLKAKIAEAIGLKAIAERIELFNHVDLFYVEREDGLIFLNTPDDHKSKLLLDLVKDKVNYCINYELKLDILTNYIAGSIFSQYFVYELMRMHGKTKFNFAISDFLEISNKLIY
jgi:Predicted phosphosugar isomerases